MSCVREDGQEGEVKGNSGMKGGTRGETSRLELAIETVAVSTLVALRYRSKDFGASAAILEEERKREREGGRERTNKDRKSKKRPCAETAFRASRLVKTRRAFTRSANSGP